ncbi:MAG TPA: META domain-containing protein [Flavobacterium sp.]|uniref:META domain-containing protein n=1 Tax=Flavobacterium sp. TaxID=239 RepID=UPI002CDC4C29|nr:META domain-containing protein [Flavobacterium sp.]HSD15344.1 META domain-containing protein [Flavobacterium sp.]
MRKCLFTAVTLCLSFISCNSVKIKNHKEDQFEKLNGSWELIYISGQENLFNELYHDKKPTINFITKDNVVSGNSSCNSYSGKLIVDGDKISFKEPMAMTRMMCGDGKGESIYMENLQKINSYSVSEDSKTLNFNMDNKPLMRFKRK